MRERSSNKHHRACQPHTSRLLDIKTRPPAMLSHGAHNLLLNVAGRLRDAYLHTSLFNLALFVNFDRVAPPLDVSIPQSLD